MYLCGFYLYYVSIGDTMASHYSPESILRTQQHLMECAAEHSGNRLVAEALVDIALSEVATIFYVQNEQAALDPWHPSTLMDTTSGEPKR